VKAASGAAAAGSSGSSAGAAAGGPGKEGPSLPVVAVLVSGAETAMDEALWCVRLGRAVQVDPVKPTLQAYGTKHLGQKHDKPPSILHQFCFQFHPEPLQMGWPLIVVEGTGGTADAVAWATARENRSHFVPNPKLMEIAREGNVETVRLTGVDGKTLQAMIERLFNGMGASTAWRTGGVKQAKASDTAGVKKAAAATATLAKAGGAGGSGGSDQGADKGAAGDGAEGADGGGGMVIAPIPTPLIWSFDHTRRIVHVSMVNSPNHEQ
jgi:hypothetical protein